MRPRELRKEGVRREVWVEERIKGKGKVEISQRGGEGALEDTAWCRQRYKSN